MVFYIYELRPDSCNFALEIFVGDIGETWESWEGWYLTSNSDTAYFKSDLKFGEGYKLITQDSLVSPLSLNSQGDKIALFPPDHQEWALDMICYGEVPDAEIAAPKVGQSICLNEYYDDYQRYYYYLDNTPTLGAANDSSGAWGYIQGTVTDSSGSPLQGIEIIYDHLEINQAIIKRSVFSDTSGYFILKDLARLEYISYNSGGSKDISFGTFQIWPDDTVSSHLVIKNPSSVHGDNISKVLYDFELYQNYPNPFNASTRIEYRLPARTTVELSIFSIDGRLLDGLVSGVQAAGSYQIEWQAQSYASGVYFYQLKAGKNVITKKLLLIR
jgi:hypothetical protein